MTYWWVNHGQTFKIEIEEGYIWSPFTNNNGGVNQSYLNVNRAALNDVIFSYANLEISAVGIVSKNAIKSAKPEAFGKAGNNWPMQGWLLEVKWIILNQPLYPKDYLQSIINLLPTKYSPIRIDGNGNQGIYLASISQQLGNLLVDFIAIKNIYLKPYIINEQNENNEEIEMDNIFHNTNSPTHRTALIEARIGQGIFRKAVERIEKKCRLTDVTQKEFLIASHIKPWKDCNDEEKLDGYNGLLLSPHADKLFDRGYMSFTDDGLVLLAHSDLKSLMSSWDLDITKNVGPFTEKQKKYLRYHREDVFQNICTKMNTKFPLRY